MLGLFLPFCSPLHVLRTWCICRNWFTLLRSHALPCALLSASGLGPSKAVPAFLPGLAQEVSSCVPQSLKLQTTFQSYQSLSHSLSHCQFHCGSHQSLWATTPSWHSGNLRQSFFSRHRNSHAQRSVKRWRNREASCNIMRLSMWLSVKFQDVKLRPAARWSCQGAENVPRSISRSFSCTAPENSRFSKHKLQAKGKWPKKTMCVRKVMCVTFPMCKQICKLQERECSPVAFGETLYMSCEGKKAEVIWKSET